MLVLELGESSLKCIIRSNFVDSPHQNMNNGNMSGNGCFHISQVFKPFSKVLGKSMRSWKSIVKKVSECPPQLSEEIRNANIQSAIQFRGREFGVSLLRVAELDRNNLSKIADHQNVKKCGFKSWEEVREMFGLEEAKKMIWNIIISILLQH